MCLWWGLDGHLLFAAGRQSRTNRANDVERSLEAA